MATIKTTLYTMQEADFAKLKPDPANFRPLRYKAGLATSILAGWNPDENDVADDSGRVSHTVDYPVIGHDFGVIRGCGRLGCIKIGLEGGPNSRDKTAAKWKKWLASAKIVVLRLAKGTPDSAKRRMANDNDPLKEAWSRGVSYRAWLAYVEQDGLSPEAASLAVRYTSRRQAFEDVRKQTPAMQAAWLDYADGNADATPITDKDLAELGKLATAYHNVNPKAPANDNGPEYETRAAEILKGDGKTGRAAWTQTRKETVEQSRRLRGLPGRVSWDTVADVLLTLAGVNPDGGKKAKPLDKGALAAYISVEVAKVAKASKTARKTAKA